MAVHVYIIVCTLPGVLNVKDIERKSEKLPHKSSHITVIRHTWIGTVLLLAWTASSDVYKGHCYWLNVHRQRVGVLVTVKPGEYRRPFD